MPTFRDVPAARRKVLTTGLIAKHCNVAPRTVSKWIDSGRLKGYRIPGSDDRRVTREEFVRFLVAGGMPLGEYAERACYKVLLIGAGPVLMEQLLEAFGPDDLAVTPTDCTFSAGMICRDFKPDTIVIDLSIGRSEAARIAWTLRAASESLHLVAIAWDDEAKPEILKEHGFNDVFQRPFDPALLAETIRVIAEAKLS